MELKETLVCQDDPSVNFIFKGDFPGYYEARYVRRRPEYFTCYLSSQTNCRQACKMCWLTASGQVDTHDAGLQSYLTQARTVLDHYEKNCPRAQWVNFSFQARGSALANAKFRSQANEVLTRLGDEAMWRDLLPKFCISTIIPQVIVDNELTNIFPVIHPTIYYSLYSLDKEFRKKWLPKALPVDVAMGKLKRYQDHSGKVIRLHWAFIEGENDSYATVKDIVDCVQDNGLRVDVNIVRYNPYSPVHGKEPSEDVIMARANDLLTLLPKPTRVKVVTRQGSTVYASCGQFVPK